MTHAHASPHLTDLFGIHVLIAGGCILVALAIAVCVVARLAEEAAAERKRGRR